MPWRCFGVTKEFSEDYLISDKRRFPGSENGPGILQKLLPEGR